MSDGYQGTHQDWLEDRASHQLEREQFEREYRALPEGAYWVNKDAPEEGHDFPLNFDVAGDGWQLICDGSGFKRIWTAEVEWLTDEQMVKFAHAILSEVELAQRGDTNDD